MSTFEHDPARSFPSEVAVPDMGGFFSTEALFDSDNEHDIGPQSSWAERALAHVEQHLQSEQAVVEAYEQLRSESSGAVAYLLDLILSDERRHHRVFAELANAMRSAAPGATSTGTSVPPPAGMTDEQRARLLEATRQFLAVERDDERGLRELQHELRPARTSTIWPLLVELMMIDTDKHQKVLHHMEHMLSS